jgi:transcriptional regulator with XRE-family HTH domain
MISGATLVVVIQQRSAAVPLKKKTPPPLVDYVTQIADALTGISEGNNAEEALAQALDGAVRAAWSLAPERARNPWDRPGEASFGGIIADHLKELRAESGWTQERLAGAMAQIGFPWRRITVAEVETDTRRVSLDELLGLAAVFGVPALTLVIPDDQTVLEWHDRSLESMTVIDLLLGEEGRMGKGGLTWKAAAQAAGAPGGTDDWRPAADLWRKRGAVAGSTEAPRWPR